MTTHWRQKASSILVLVLMIFLLIVIIFLWTAVSNGVFTTNRTTINNRINISENRIIEQQSTSNWKKERNKSDSTISPTDSSLSSILSSSSSSSPSTIILSSSSSSTLSPINNEYNHTPPPPDIQQHNISPTSTNVGLEDITNIEYIKPSKIHVQPLHEDDLLYESKKIEQNSGINIESPENFNHHITGHFRNKSSRIWDPHPQYEIDAFGLHLHLILYHDADFIPKNIKVTHVWPNETLRLNDDLKDFEKLQGCFYKGHVRGDEKSAVAVSLCDGMRGHIRTSSGSFFIQPVEKYTNEHTNILHAIYRVPTLPKFYPSQQQQTQQQQSQPGHSNCAVQSGNFDYNWSNRDNEPDLALEQFESSSSDNNNNNNHVRHKRSSVSSVNNAYTMEVLVAVDRKMQEYHGDAINSYVLTLMSIVSSIYADASIGNSINVAVVHVLHLKHDFNLHSHQNGVSASTMLVEFCKLKQQFKFPHDTALLLTREQICRNENQTKCDTLGLAELGTMCNSYSCSIVQDNGLSAAFTIAHELGHVLNMPHDDDPKCDKYRETGQTKQNIMSRMLDHNTYPWLWSNCSRHFVTEFLEKDRGKCMLNKPELDLIEPTWPNSKLAGEKFTNDEQCELVFGPGSKICSYMPVCNRLWCSEGDRESEGCRTQHMPWADGTTCGFNRWCQKGECIHRNRTALKPIDGGWGHWSRYGDCSRPCGGGVHESTRACDSPAPANGGKYCIGYRIKYRSCNTEQCSSDRLDFREEQCTELDNNNFEIPGLEKDVKWVPKYGVAPSDECKLFCRVHKSHSYFVLKDKVKDGTPCSHDSFNKCVNGVCRPAGCDNELDSTAKLDKCGVCNGRNETCLDITGTYSYPQIVRDENKAAHYYRVVRIPKGSSNIDIRQPGYGKDNNYIALMDDQGDYKLNGKNLITSYPITFLYDSVRFYYTGANNSMERVNTTYAIRLQRDIFVMILSLHPMDRYHNDEFVKYSYTISKQDYDKQFNTDHERQSHTPHVRKPHYQWKMSEWSECNQLCMGQKFQSAACIQIDAGLKVSPNHCYPHPKPGDEYKTCNTDCELNWEMANTECSNPCGDGHREIKYNCIQTYLRTRHSNIVDASYCPSTRPISSMEQCHGDCEHATWIYGDWEPCSHTCGSGHQNRSITCYSSELGFPIEPNFCDNIKKEYTQKLCNPEPCPEWAYGIDTPCSVTCGEGKSTTAIVCKQNNVIVNAALCGNIPRLVTIVKKCTMEPCKIKQTLRFDKVKDPGITYSHFVDSENIVPQTRNGDIYTFANRHIIPNSNTISSRYEWRTGRWGKCSVSCGTGGMRTRTVRCSNLTSTDNRYVDDHYCDSALRPIHVTNCTEGKCLDWSVGEWGVCNHTCRRHRSVTCHNNQTGEVDRTHCTAQTEPNHSEVCCHYKWRTKLSACSVTCGIGVRTKQRLCVKVKQKSKDNPNPTKNGEVMPDNFCSHLKPPPFKKFKEQCKRSCYRWETSAWSECSAGCGNGGSTRKVTCTNGKETSTTECNPKIKPLNYRTCEGKTHCQWKLGKWKNCNCSGFMKRRIICMDTLRGLRSNQCSDNDKPHSRTRCAAPTNCSCQKLKERKGIHFDGEYLLNVRGKDISIYCHNMTSTNPLEYVTLAAGPQQNYASYYSRRAKDPTVCPRETRNDEWEEALLPHGTTTFSKIRVLLHSLQVVEDDLTFAQTGGQAKSFGSAGDCYSKTEVCPQGAFSINLTGTGFRIRPRTQWETKGPNSTIIFMEKLQPPFTKVTARCGGYCGSCFPSKRTMLHLETIGVQ